MGCHGGNHGGRNEETGREAIEGGGSIGNTPVSLSSFQPIKRA